LRRRRSDGNERRLRRSRSSSTLTVRENSRFALTVFLDLSPLRKHREFRLLYAGQSVSRVGSMLTYVAVPYQIFQITQSPLWVGLLGSAQLVPLFFAGLFGGVLADSLDRRRMLVVSELVLALGSASLVANALVPHPSAVLVFVVSALMGGVNGFHQPALQAMTPRMVDREDIPAVAALGSLQHNLSAIGGPACAGVLIAVWGLPVVYAIDVLSFGASVVCLALLRPPPSPIAEPASSLARIAEGLRYALKRPELIGTYVVDIVAMTFAMPMALFPSMGRVWGGAAATGWLYSSMSIGSLAMTLLSGWTSRVRRHGAAVIVAAAAWGVAIIGLGFAPGLPLAMACLVIAGAADMVSGIFRSTIWNQTIPDHLRGRLAGVEMISYMTGPLLGNARAGTLASLTNDTFAIASGGALCFLGVIACIPLLPGFWRYQSDAQPSRIAEPLSGRPEPTD
jgi:MFS family permease